MIQHANDGTQRGEIFSDLMPHMMAHHCLANLSD